MTHKQTNEVKKSITNEEEGTTEEIMDQRGASVDGDAPGEVHQSGRRQVSMAKRGSDQQI